MQKKDKIKSVKNRPSLDGFIVRREQGEMGQHHVGHKVKKTSEVLDTRPQLHTGDNVQDLSKRPQKTTAGTAAINQSLQAIDEDSQPVSRRERRRNKRAARKASKPRKIAKLFMWLFIIAVLATAGFLAYKFTRNLNSVFKGNIFDLVQKRPLKEDANGRSNFLIFGTEIEGHPGANLTDSIMVLSVNQTTKDAFMVSIPRDLWVDFGAACLSGYQGKINEVYMCHSSDGEDEAKGAAALQKKVGEVLGLDIQYYVHLNFESMKDVVDAVGGVTVTIESNPKGVGVLDRNFDWECNYQCYYVKYEDGQVVKLDGKHALALARARNAQGGYGLAGGNFDREKNQQKIIKALREEALSVGTLTNLGKVTSLMDALGNNLKTNIEKNEIQTLMSIASEINTDAIISPSLVDEENALVTIGNVGGVSIVRPVPGLYNYSEIQAFIDKVSVNNPVSREAAPVAVLNGTSTSGVAAKESRSLSEKGYNVKVVGDAPKGSYQEVEIYRVKDGYDETTKALEAHYGVSVKDSQPGFSLQDGVAFVVVIGRVRD